ncbi:hypothetical protein ACFYNM_38705, partial [Streptomyces spororaveus]|uniref:hypothetical protein n=1 Tax=Streptomyces spororaveus TaxID=284039 RepID=UPI00369D0EBB
ADRDASADGDADRDASADGDADRDASADGDADRDASADGDADADRGGRCPSISSVRPGLPRYAGCHAATRTGGSTRQP